MLIYYFLHDDSVRVQTYHITWHIKILALIATIITTTTIAAVILGKTEKWLFCPNLLLTPYGGTWH